MVNKHLNSPASKQQSEQSYTMSLFEEDQLYFKLSGSNNNTITRINNGKHDWTNVIYMKNWLPSTGIFRWKITNHSKSNLHGAARVRIAFITDSHRLNDSNTIMAGHSYIYADNGYIYKNGTRTGNSGTLLRFAAGRVALFTLDFDKAQIKMSLNKSTSKSLHTVLFDDIQTGSKCKYKLAISIKNPGDSVSVSPMTGLSEESSSESDVSVKQSPFKTKSASSENRKRSRDAIESAENASKSTTT